LYPNCVWQLDFSSLELLGSLQHSQIPWLDLGSGKKEGQDEEGGKGGREG